MKATGPTVKTQPQKLSGSRWQKLMNDEEKDQSLCETPTALQKLF